jgi:hypothetical protein
MPEPSLKNKSLKFTGYGLFPTILMYFLHPWMVMLVKTSIQLVITPSYLPLGKGILAFARMTDNLGSLLLIMIIQF